jgi:ABC-type phosphate/phosphonate transport system permease subunit
MPITLDQVGNWTKLTKLADIFFTKEKVTKLTATESSTKLNNNSTFITIVICIMIMCMTGIISVSLNYINDRNNMAKNIEAAINKGVDPLSVKCAYETNPTATCISYALNVKK